MERSRIILALVLMAIVLFGWPYVMRLIYPQPETPPVLERPQSAVQQQPEKREPAAAQPPVTAQPAVQTPVTQAPERNIVIETDLYRATFSSKGGVATSWILKQEKFNGKTRELRAADGGPLELIPQDAVGRVGAPFRLHLPWASALAGQLNAANFSVEGASQDEIRLQPGQSQQLTFTYSSPAGTARKAFTFYGDQFTVDATAQVTAGGSQQPTYLVYGPRIGDQADRQTGSYSTPHQVIALTAEGKREAVLGAGITPAFAKIVGIDHSAKQIQIDHPLAGDVNQVKILSADGKDALAYALVAEREANNQLLTLDAIPEGAVVGSPVAQGTDTVRHPVRWTGVVDHYFAMIAIPSQPVGEIVLTDTQMRAADPDAPPVNYPSVAVPVDDRSPTRIFVGPKDRDLLGSLGAQLGTDLGALIDYGMFAWMIRPIVPLLGMALDGLARIFHNYGWSIVLVTLIINLALSPLRWYSSKKMKSAAKHQPRMKELQERMKKYRENPKKYERELAELQREQMSLMKEANPLGGCLPLLLQMPIFWAFFVYLTISLDVRHAPWVGWVRDLSTPDPYYVLPLIMCVTMIASTALTPQPNSADPAMKMQRMMMTWLMPIMLTWFFFLSAPSGLVLYWMMSNLAGVAIQLVINKLAAEPAEPPAPAGGPGANKSGVKKLEGGAAGKRGKGKQETRVGAEA